MVAPVDFDYEFMLAFSLAITLFFDVGAWFGHPSAESGEEVGYATILKWVRSISFMVIAGILWLMLALQLNAFNAGLGGASTLNDYIVFGLGMFLLHLVLGIVLVAYLTLPIERLPKPLQAFAQRNQERARLKASE